MPPKRKSHPTPETKQRSISSFFSPGAQAKAGGDTPIAKSNKPIHEPATASPQAKVARLADEECSPAHGGRTPCKPDTPQLISSPSEKPPTSPASRATRNHAEPAALHSPTGADPEDLEPGKETRSSTPRQQQPAQAASQSSPGIKENVQPSPVPTTNKNSDNHTQLGPGAEELVGRRVTVLWPDDKDWYEGDIAQYDREEGTHLVLYEDGDEEWLDLRKEQFKFVEPAPRKKAKLTSQRGRAVKKTVAPRRGRPQAMVSDDDEQDGDDGSASEFEAESEAEVESEGGSESDAPSMDSDSDQDNNKKQAKKKAASKTKTQAKSAGSSQVCRPTKLGNSQASTVPAAKGKPTPLKPLPASAAVGLAARTSSAAFSANHILGSVDPLPLTGVAAERFQNRDAEMYTFLLPQNRRDSKGRLPDHPEFDSTTLMLPKTFPNIIMGNGEKKTISGGQAQWWKFKAANFDAVIFFKMGKFYELFEMDAHVGVEHLGLQYMAGAQPHAGFPEKGYAAHAETLVRKGFRLVVVEQTETPDQLAERNRASSGPKDKVVMREKVAVLTKGTLVDYDMLEAQPDASFLLTVWESSSTVDGNRTSSAPSAKDMDSNVLGSEVTLGLCALDAGTGRFLLGKVRDDGLRSKLRAVLSQLLPVELVLPPTPGLSGPTLRALKEGAPTALQKTLKVDNQGEFWGAERTLRDLREGGYFTDKTSNQHEWPEVLGALVEAGEEAHSTLAALGTCASYLRECLLDHDLLPLKCFQLMPGAAEGLEPPDSADAATLGELGDRGCAPGGYMELDSAAMENLEVLQNCEGGTQGTLLAQMDHCVTGAGRRLLQRWLCRPLRSPGAILARQEAVSDLLGEAREAAGRARAKLRSVPDLERSLSRLHAGAQKTGRNMERVVLYEDHSKKRLLEFLAALRGLRQVAGAVAEFAPASLQSPRLRNLVTPGSWEQRREGMCALAPALQPFQDAFDWEAAAESGRIVPREEGVDSAYDAARARVGDAETAMHEWLHSQRADIQCAQAKFVHQNKDLYLLELPVQYERKVPRDYEKCSMTKDVVRFTSPELETLKAARASAVEAQEAALEGILHRQLEQFCGQWETWKAAVAAVAELDVLCSFALAADSYTDGAVCVPEVRACAEGQAPSLHASGLRHPCAPAGMGHGGFVPNDTTLGNDKAPFLLLTGPNMGGKSTLLRQVCLATIMAQVGARVPAEAFHLSPVDTIFVRMGAKDNILARQSTFLVELAETASVLQNATRHSLVALDELGRGTATGDGAAIAYSVMRHLAHNVHCRSLFSTHYHMLADEHAHDTAVQLGHMGCHVASGNNGEDLVTFLYKLTNGACPKSYGVNVARLAGLPASVLACAARTAAAHEAANQGTAPDIQDDNTRKLLVQLSKHSCSEQMYGELRSMWELAQTIALPQVRECSSLIPKQ